MKHRCDVLVSLLLVAALLYLPACNGGSSAGRDDASSPTESEAPAQEERAEAAETDSTTTEDAEEGDASSDDASEDSSESDESSHENAFWDYQTGEWIDFDDISHIHELCDVKEYADGYYSKVDWPTDISAELAGNLNVAKGEITDPDIVRDLWERVVRMRLRLSEAVPDETTSKGESLTFYWEDGHSQTFTFKGSWSLAYDGTLYPIFEHRNTDGENFSTPVVQPVPNPYYPGAVFDVIPRLTGKSSSKGPVIVVVYGSSSVHYEDDSFLWNVDGDYPSETMRVRKVEGNAEAAGGIALEDVWGEKYSCVIEGATRLVKVVIASDEDVETALITYEAGDSGETKQCRVACVDDALSVTYL